MAASAACLVAPETALPVGRSNRMTVPSSVRMQEVPRPLETTALVLSLKGVAGAAGETAPAVPVAWAGSTGSGTTAPGLVQAGEEDSPDEWEETR